jgi:hypothetical protein
MAFVEVEAGDYESAIARFEYLMSIPSIVTVEYMRGCPFPDEMVSNPSFQAILEKGNKVF